MVPTYRRSTKRQVSFLHMACLYDANCQFCSPFFFQKYHIETAFVSPRRRDGGKWGAAVMNFMPYPVTSSFLVLSGRGGETLVTGKTPDARILTSVIVEHHRRCDGAGEDNVDDDDDDTQKAKRRSVVDDDADDALLEASFTAYLKKRKVTQEVLLEQEGEDANVAGFVLDSSPVKEGKASGTGTVTFARNFFFFIWKKFEEDDSLSCRSN